MSVSSIRPQEPSTPPAVNATPSVVEPPSPTPNSQSESKQDEISAQLKTEDRLTTSAQGNSEPAITLSFDDSLPATQRPETRENNRFPDRGRPIHIPLLAGDEGGLNLINPFFASGFRMSDHRLGGVVLEGPPTDPRHIFSATDTPSQAVAALFDHLSEKFPNLEESVLWRLAKVGTYVAIDIPLMVAAHEMGHGATALDQCPSCSTTVVMSGFASGYTSYTFPEGTVWNDRADLLTSVAGFNQATYNGEEVNRRMHTEGASVADAVSYLTNITNSVNYQMKDWITNAEPGFNDAASYTAILEQREKGWNEENLAMLSLGVNLLNADFWASLIGTVNYVVTGDQIKLPEIKMGDVHMSLPHFSLMHTYEGPQLNVSLYGHKGTQETLELKYSSILTPDNGPAMGLEGRLHNLRIPGTDNQLSMTPELGVSIHNQQAGFKVGTEFEYRPNNNRHFSTTFGVGYSHNYLPESYLPDSNGLDVRAGVKLSF